MVLERFCQGIQFCSWKLMNQNSYEKIKRLKNCRICNLQVSRLPLWNLKSKSHFHAVPIARSKVYYKEGNVGLFPSLNHVNVMSPKQVQDSKLTLFPLTACMTKFQWSKVWSKLKMFQQYFCLFKTLIIWLWFYFIWKYIFFKSNVHHFFLQLKRILILMMKRTTWIELGKIHIFTLLVQMCLLPCKLWILKMCLEQ
jgi:hypothetical protein